MQGHQSGGRQQGGVNQEESTRGRQPGASTKERQLQGRQLQGRHCGDVNQGASTRGCQPGGVNQGRQLHAGCVNCIVDMYSTSSRNHAYILNSVAV